MTIALDVIQLDRDRTCTRCDLHDECKTVCIPTTLHGARPLHKEGYYEGKFRAILIVGEAPGGQEDIKDQPFVGPSGLVLRRLYIEFFKLTKKADVYCGNAVRCRPSGNRTPNKTQLKACNGFLLADVLQLQRDYDEVLILVVGGPAARAVWGTSLKEAFLKQGDFTDWHSMADAKAQAVEAIEKIAGRKFPVVDTGHADEFPKPCRVFSTYHPAFIQREPSSGLAVKRHIQMLTDYLDGNLENDLPELLDIQVAPMPPNYPLGRLSLDIETYGIVKGLPKQRFFHPKLSIGRDFVSKEHLVQTVGLTWRGYDIPGRGENIIRPMRHAIFYMDDVNHRRRLWAWLRKCRDEEGFEFLLGQNIVFDLMYLRYAYPEARVFLEDPLPVMDLMILNYLHDESRPEKSLKALAPLFRVSKYGETKIKGEYKRYNDRRVPELAQYNCQDTASTLRIAEKLMSEIRGFYGKDTKKLSPFCMKWYSQLLWLIVWMSEEGICMDKPRLQTLFDCNEKALNAIVRAGRELYDMPLRGKGSEKAKRSMMNNAIGSLEEDGCPLPDLEITDEKKEVRFSADNRNALMALLPHSWYSYKQLKLFGAYQDVSGLMDRYLYPLLVGGGKKHDTRSSVLFNGVVYPKWFSVPSEFEDSSRGGTKQARLSAKAPSVPTFPPSIKATISGRFRGGYLIWFDYSQIELRVAALLSGDPAMRKALSDPKRDLHWDTAQLMFGKDVVTPLERQAGKTFNFRALYRGGAKTGQTTLMKTLGIRLELDQIAAIDSAFWKRHRRLREWQDELVASVRANGYYELPLIGQSRLFLGGRKAKDKALNEIVNLPDQAIAADIMLSAQYALWARFKQESLKAIVPCNIYDAGLVECPKFEIFRVRRLMAEILPNPPFYQALCDELGRTLPLEYEVKEIRC